MRPPPPCSHTLSGYAKGTTLRTSEPKVKDLDKIVFTILSDSNYGNIFDIPFRRSQTSSPLSPKMKLFLVAIAVIAAIHHGHGKLSSDSSACEISDAFDVAMGLAESEEMGCDDMLDGGTKFDADVSKA